MNTQERIDFFFDIFEAGPVPYECFEGEYLKFLASGQWADPEAFAVRAAAAAASIPPPPTTVTRPGQVSCTPTLSDFGTDPISVRWTFTPDLVEVFDSAMALDLADPVTAERSDDSPWAGMMVTSGCVEVEVQLPETVIAAHEGRGQNGGKGHLGELERGLADPGNPNSDECGNVNQLLERVAGDSPALSMRIEDVKTAATRYLTAAIDVTIRDPVTQVILVEHRRVGNNYTASDVRIAVEVDSAGKLITAGANDNGPGGGQEEDTPMCKKRYQEE